MLDFKFFFKLSKLESCKKMVIVLHEGGYHKSFDETNDSYFDTDIG